MACRLLWWLQTTIGQTEETATLLHFTDIELGRGPAQACHRCASGGTEVLRETAEIIEEIEGCTAGWNDGAGPNLAFTGVEPCNHPELERIVRSAVRAGARRVRLDTSAGGFATLEDAARLLDAGVRHVQFTLLGASAESHDALAGAPGRYAATARGVEVFSASAGEKGLTVAVSARIPLCRHNVSELLEAVATAAGLGASFVRLAIEDPHLDVASAVPWIEAACDTGLVNSAWVEVEGVPFCLAGSWHLHLAATYGSRAGAKATVCATCPLDSVCGGTVAGASERVLATLGPPAGAGQLAESVTRGLHPLERP